MAVAESAMKELEEMIDFILKPLKEKDPTAPLEAMRDGILNMLKAENNNISITPEDFAGPQKAETEKALRITCASEYIKQNDPSFKFDPTTLFKSPDKMDNDKENKDDLKSTFQKIFEKMFQLKPKDKKKSGKENEEDEKEINEKLENLANTLSKNLKEDDSDTQINKNKSASSIISKGFDFIADSIEANWGGVDTRNPGSIVKTILAAPGDSLGSEENATPEGDSFKASTEKTTGPDLLGDKVIKEVENIANGDPERSEHELRDEGILTHVSGSTPRFTPPGTTQH